MPYIGRIKERMLIGTGYNTWGLTNGFLAGKMLSDIILNRDNKYYDLFNPKRVNMRKIISSVGNIIKNINGYIKGLVIKNENVLYKRINGKTVILYKDKDNKKYMLYNTCPHMGCKLIFNKVEKTWDCPCHASRFNIKGECISGPSNRNITYK